MLEFLEVFANTCNRAEAARAANVSESSVDKYRRSHAAFGLAYVEAEKIAVEKLEGIVLRRAAHGDRRLKFNPKTGAPYVDPATGKPYEEVEYSDTLQIALLKAHKPERYREKLDVTVEAKQPLTAAERAERLAELAARRLKNGDVSIPPPLPEGA